ncbi:MAG: hypothetical protein QNK04_34425 [Myxococcota bacterium]|nr:hypothetical protein [Myxococcota bacterium]
MPAEDHRLTTREMARFVAEGYLCFDALVPEHVNGRVIEDGWFLLQSPAPYPLHPGAEHATPYLPNEFVFERRVEVARPTTMGSPTRT